MTRVRAWAPLELNLPGKMKAHEIKSLIGWLLEDDHFKYGDLNAEVCSHLSVDAVLTLYIAEANI